MVAQAGKNQAGMWGIITVVKMFDFLAKSAARRGTENYPEPRRVPFYLHRDDKVRYSNVRV